MKRMLVALALAIVPVTISPAAADVRPSSLPEVLPAPAPEPVCIVILGKKICW
jgi:hypothetical protein